MEIITVHFAFGTYGTRLHGGQAPTVSRSQNRVGEPFIEWAPELYEINRSALTEPPCYLDQEQRLFVEEKIPLICDRGSWTYHIAGCQSDHVHALLSMTTKPKAVRKWLKTWLTQGLNERFFRRTWFAEGGSGKWIFDDSYFQNAYQYILKQRTHGTV
jgi:REP element-mobilizing transposase RayT